MALASHTPTTWTDILASTMHNLRGEFTDNFFDARPYLNHINSNGRKRTVPGGISIVEPLLYAEGDFVAYAEWDAVAVTPVNTLTAAQFAWKLLAGTVAISGLEEAQNNSREMRVNLLEAKIEQMKMTLQQNMNRMLLGTYGGADAANGFTGLPAIIGTNEADLPVIGAVPQDGTNTWWESVISNQGSANGVPVAIDGAALEDALRDAYNAASDAGGDTVDAILTNAYGFGFYESTLTPQVRYSDVEKANLGFQNLMFKNCPVFWDFDCPGVDDYITTATSPGTNVATSTTQACYYGINSKYVGLTVHADRDMQQSPFTDNLAGNTGGTGSASGVGTAATHSIDARVSYNTTYGEHTVRNRRRLFKVTNVQES